MSAPTLGIRRQLQRFIVQIPRWVIERSTANADIELVHDGISVLTNPKIHYSEHTGLNLEAQGPGSFFS